MNGFWSDRLNLVIGVPSDFGVPSRNEMKAKYKFSSYYREEDKSQAIFVYQANNYHKDYTIRVILVKDIKYENESIQYNRKTDYALIAKFGRFSQKKFDQLAESTLMPDLISRLMTNCEKMDWKFCRHSR